MLSGGSKTLAQNLKFYTADRNLSLLVLSIFYRELVETSQREFHSVLVQLQVCRWVPWSHERYLMSRGGHCRDMMFHFKALPYRLNIALDYLFESDIATAIAKKMSYYSFPVCV